MTLLYAFDLIGTFAFAAYGAYLAARHEFDLFGIFTYACVSAFAGGTIRCLLLNQLPIYFTDSWYFLMIFLGIGFAILLFKHFSKIQKLMLSIDALGLVTFAFLGATAALQTNLGLIGVLIFSVLSAVGGGVCCDLLVRDIPRIFYRDFYATTALIVGIVCFFLKDHLTQPFVVDFILFSCFCLRLLAIKYRFTLWKPFRAGTLLD
jgi:uncharacterized membrane protein YeiH